MEVESETYDMDCCSNSDDIIFYVFCRVWYSRLAWSLWYPRNLKMCILYRHLAGYIKSSNQYKNDLTLVHQIGMAQGFQKNIDKDEMDRKYFQFGQVNLILDVWLSISERAIL
jgi:hypothetical protein